MREANMFSEKRQSMLRNILIRNTVERTHLAQVLPDLYAAYHDLPLDAD